MICKSFPQAIEELETIQDFVNSLHDYLKTEDNEEMYNEVEKVYSLLRDSIEHLEYIRDETNPFRM